MRCLLEQEVSSSADWVKQAAEIARRKEQDGGYAKQKVLTAWCSFIMLCFLLGQALVSSQYGASPG
jgi:hypothetical protein